MKNRTLSGLFLSVCLATFVCVAYAKGAITEDTLKLLKDNSSIVGVELGKDESTVSSVLNEISDNGISVGKLVLSKVTEIEGIGTLKEFNNKSNSVTVYTANDTFVSCKLKGISEETADSITKGLDLCSYKEVLDGFVIETV